MYHTFKKAVLAAGLATLVASTAHAGVSQNDAATMCKAQAKEQFSEEGKSPRIKYRGASRKDGAQQIRLQVYPKGGDSFKATCSMNRQTGQIFMLAREDAPNKNLLQTAER